MIRDQIKQNIINALIKSGYKIPEEFTPEIEIPKDRSHGDFSTNAALILSKELKINPRDIAAKITENIEKGIFEKVDIAGPGFINFFLKNNAWHKILKEVLEKKLDYGHQHDNPGAKKINLEFVSVNPTGPMHLAHGRWAVLGDTLANVLDFAGNKVTREYYVNDYGNQVNLLGKSLKARYLQSLGEKCEFPQDGYHGEYLIDLADKLKEEKGDSLKDASSGEFKNIAIDYMLNKLILKALKASDVRFDVFFHESQLQKENKVNEALKKLEESGHTYKKDGAVFFKSTDFGDDKDRVIIKEDGESTYFLADTAYHLNKMQRSFDLLINIWGADHHGYVKRMKGAFQSLGYNPDDLLIIIGQLVTLTKGGEIVKMSKRSGQMVTFQELLDEVGKDAVRFIFLTKSANTHLEFDLELAKKQSQENPVYYVQYAHARICSILKSAENKSDISSADLTLLTQKEEINIIKKLETLPFLITLCAKNFEVHQLTHYSQELASLFHSFYNKHRVLNPDNPGLTLARIYLITAIQIVLNITGRLLGVNMPESM
ncbi:MAG: arginine--tRNA ligase [Armatimonadota bacterium]